MFKYNSLVPELTVSSLKRSLDSYCGILQFSVEYDRPENHFAYLSFNGSHLMLEQNDQSASPWKTGKLEYPFGRGINLSIVCPNADELASRILEAGISLQKPLENRWYRNRDLYHGERNFLVLDPDGYLLRFNQDLGMKQRNE